MLLKGPNSEEITIEDGTIETLTVKDLSEKLPEIKDKQFVFVADGFVLDPAKALKDYSLNKSTIVNCLVKPETKVDVKESAREKARASLPPNPLEVVKSFRVLLDQLDLPFGEKLKDMVNNEETFATILATVPGLKEDEESVKMLKSVNPEALREEGQHRGHQGETPRPPLCNEPHQHPTHIQHRHSTSHAVTLQ